MATASLSAAQGPVTPEEQINQFREFLTSYNRLADQCFVDCINDFSKRTITETEETCAMTCIDKYLKATQRISMRFQEFQLTVNESAIAGQMPPGMKK